MVLTSLHLLSVSALYICSGLVCVQWTFAFIGQCVTTGATTHRGGGVISSFVAHPEQAIPYVRLLHLRADLLDKQAVKLSLSPPTDQ